MAMTHQLTLSLGSNEGAKRNIANALDSLRAQFGELRVSSVYESEAVGFDGDNFLNLVVVVETTLSLAVVQEFLKHLEVSQGRDSGQVKFSSRPIDVDILTYEALEGPADGGAVAGAAAGIVLPRPEITENAYVLLPLAELLPEQIHAPSQKTYAQLWAEYDQASQRLWPIPFDYA
jgi:2-amino-4-hydroxy-6-hydroxymethyldihydropteridine diphosphokinase